MKLFAATNNDHKVRELKSLFPRAQIITPKEAGVEFDFDETEDTFLGNSLGKARAFHELIGAPVLADDSGLCVDALDGAPGVFSARYGVPLDGAGKLSDGEKNKLLIAAMEGKSDRRCRFVCAMCLIISKDRFLFAQETCEGTLLDGPRGIGGFGYDPIFLIPELELSMAELSFQQKNVYSHRGRASARINAALRSLPD